MLGFLNPLNLISILVVILLIIGAFWPDIVRDWWGKVNLDILVDIVINLAKLAINNLTNLLKDIFRSLAEQFLEKFKEELKTK